VIQATVKDVSCTLMTSHLESTASHVDERKRQLKTAFDALKKHDNTVIFGGDLNLRDKEVCWLLLLYLYQYQYRYKNTSACGPST